VRTWTKSACVVLARSILPIILITIGMLGSAHPAQANTRTACSTEIKLTSTLSPATAPAAAVRPHTKYVVQYGDTLSGIAARFTVPGGWQTLYAANHALIGPDPNVLRAGWVLVVPGHRAPAHYTVAAGDTLSGIAAQLAVPGGWRALYAANRRAIGPDPNAIHAGTVLAVPGRAAPRPPASAKPEPPHERPPTPPPSVPVGTAPHSRPVTHRAPATSGMPRWLKIMLLTVGLFIMVALLAEPVLIARRRRRRATAALAAQLLRTEPDRMLGAAPPGRDKGSIVVADHDRVVVTRSMDDDTVYVLRPPGADPKAILRVARVVLPEGSYGELAKQLGMPAIGPVD
jgi:LysM repeat protein